jgi:hypothetical protein
MSNLPITSRIKRSPLLSQEAEAIDPDNPLATTVGGTIIKSQPKRLLHRENQNITTQGPLDTLWQKRLLKANVANEKRFSEYLRAL